MRHRSGFTKAQRTRTGKGHVAAQNVKQHRQFATRRASGEAQARKRSVRTAQAIDRLEQAPALHQGQHRTQQPQRRQHDQQEQRQQQIEQTQHKMSSAAHET